MSSAEQNTGGSSAVYIDRWVELAGTRINYRESGQGKAVIILHAGDLAQPSPLEKLLSTKFRVLAFIIPTPNPAADQPASWRRELGHALLSAGGIDGSEYLALVSTDATAPLALRLILEQSEQFNALVLIAPQPIFPELRGPSNRSDYDAALVDRLAEIKAPTLLLLGTEDAVIPQETGAMYAQWLPNCYYVLVYDAGHSIEQERLQTLFVTISDFLEHREAFVVNRASTVLNP